MSKGKRVAQSFVETTHKSKSLKRKKALPTKSTFTITADAPGSESEEPSDVPDDEVFEEKVSKKMISLDDDEAEDNGEFLGDENDEIKWTEKDDVDELFEDSDVSDIGEDSVEEADEKDEFVDSKMIVNEESSDSPTGMKGLRERIQEILAHLEKKQYMGKSRNELIIEFKQILIQYYDYSEYMLELLFHLFKPSEFVDFLEANETPRPITIRTNTLKTRRRELAAALIARGVNVEPLDKWTPIGLQVFEGKVPIGATPEYLAGHYMLQAAASLLPVISLAPEENQRCLDMCAAPGGKSTHIAALMRNTGFLACNDISSDRITSLLANMHRMGVQNAATSCMDGRKLPGYYGNASFDRILLDAPCSGTGVISKDSGVKGKTAEDFTSLGQVQRELLLAAIDMCTINGIVVYSTCSVTVEENEAVVEYALKKRKVRIVDSGLSFGVSGFTSFRGSQFEKSMSLTKRFYPHTHNLDGFFVAKLIKYA